MTFSELSELQKWFQATCTHQQGPGASLVKEGIEAAEYIQSNSRLSAEARLGIYARAYRARLRESLREQFPVLLKVLEDTVFDCFVEGFINLHPPQGHSLLGLGGEFAQWLTQSRPANELWAEFIAELAALERIRDEVYHGPGHELSAAESVSYWQRGFPAMASFAPSPSLRLMNPRFPVDTYHAAIRAGKTPDVPKPSSIHLAIYRHEWRVRVLRLDNPEVQLLAAMLGGRKLQPEGSTVMLTVMKWLEMGLLIEKMHTWRDKKRAARTP